MPLGFRSINHGAVAFGFFHIESDMLLLEGLFFWADDFCALVETLAETGFGQSEQAVLKGYEFTDPRAIGDLHGAISGQRLQGFLGALYKRWPFPRLPHEFRQKAKGAAPRGFVLAELGKRAEQLEIQVGAHQASKEFCLGPHCFDQKGLAALVEYVWRGGMPGWENGSRPGYVTQMAATLAASGSPWFAGLELRPSMLGYDMVGA